VGEGVEGQMRDEGQSEILECMKREKKAIFAAYFFLHMCLHPLA